MRRTAFAIVLASSILSGQRFEVVSRQQLTEGARIWNADISADGKRLAYIDGTSLLTREIATGVTKRLVEKEVRSAQIRFTPDGESILFTSVDGAGKYVTQIISAEGKMLDAVTLRKGSPDSLSPDGRRIAYVRDTVSSGKGCSLIIANRDGRGERSLTPDVGAFPTLHWSRESDRIAWSRSNGLDTRLFVIDVATGQSDVLTTWRGYMPQVSWLPGTAGIVFVGRPQEGGPQQLWRVGLDHAATKLFVDQRDLIIFTAVPQPNGYLVVAGKESTAETFWDGMLGAVFGWRQPSAYEGRTDLVLIHLRESGDAKP